jgi:hypothetical protein
MAGRKVTISVCSQLIVNILTATCVALGIHWFGYVGYPLARVAVYALHVTLICWLFLRLAYPMLKYGAFLYYMLWVFVLNCAIGGILWSLGRFLPEPALLRVTIGTALYFLFLFLANRMFDISPDLRTLILDGRHRISEYATQLRL